MGSLRRLWSTCSASVGEQRWWLLAGPPCREGTRAVMSVGCGGSGGGRGWSWVDTRGTGLSLRGTEKVLHKACCGPFFHRMLGLGCATCSLELLGWPAHLCFYSLKGCVVGESSLQLADHIFSKGEILSLRPRQLAGAETCSAACCTARPAWQGGFRAVRGDLFSPVYGKLHDAGCSQVGVPPFLGWGLGLQASSGMRHLRSGGKRHLGQGGVVLRGTGGVALSRGRSLTNTGCVRGKALRRSLTRPQLARESAV